MTPTLLLILDGWGLAEPGSGNAPWLARTPNIDSLFLNNPHSRLQASGRAVGLPEGYMGNSEVGHLNIGSGRVVHQDMTRIDVAIEDGSFEANPVLAAIMQALAVSGRTLHLVGLLSDGGVHSHIEHLKVICGMAARAGVRVRIHGIMDGRDTDPHSGIKYVEDLCAAIRELPGVAISDLVGRFYAMDRDKRWERVKEAWDLMAHGVSDAGLEAPDALTALRDSYAAGVTDEFVRPVICLDGQGEAPRGMADGDGIFFFNFRADRMRELVEAFTEPDFQGFERGRVPRLAQIGSMTPYDEKFTIPVAFPKLAIHDGLGETVSRAGLRQLRLAETEKYAHVTYFFNGGLEEPFPGEDRILVPSPRDVPTYDLKPGMSAEKVTEKFLDAWNSGKYDLVVCNLANGDMVGHTGNLQAAIQACEVVDECVGKMVRAVKERKGRMLLIADHGNCEVMLNEDSQPQTAHTTNLVPCILIDPDGEVKTLADGKLADVAPTILALWGLDIPAAMQGHSLVSAR